MKYKILIVISLPLIIFGCINKTTETTETAETTATAESNVEQPADILSLESALTLTINGDGFKNKTLTFGGIPNNSTYLWAVHYFEKTMANPAGYSYAQLYFNNPDENSSEFEVESSTLNIAFSGNAPMKEKVKGGGLGNIASGRGRGIDLYIKLPNEESTRVYYMNEQKSDGFIKVSEYGERIKGTFSIQNIQQHNKPDKLITINGTFDLAYLGNISL